MQAHLFKLVALLAALALLAAFLWTPWIVFLDAQAAEEQVRAFLSNTQIRPLFEQAPQLPQWLGIAKMEDIQDVRELFSDSEIRALFELGTTRSGLTGLDLALGVPRLEPLLRILLIFVPIVSIAILLWAFLSPFARQLSFVRLASFVCGGAAFLLFASLVMFVPSLYTLGEQDDFQLAFVCMLLGTQTGIGLWLALLALFAIGVGVLLDGVVNSGDASIAVPLEQDWNF